MGRGESWGFLAMVVVAMVIICELSPSVEGAVTKPGAGQKRRTYKKSFGRTCDPALSDCNINNLLVCHPTTKKCVCTYRIHEWSDAEFGCYNPQDGDPRKQGEAPKGGATDKGEGGAEATEASAGGDGGEGGDGGDKGEGGGEGDDKEPTEGELDKEVPPPDENGDGEPDPETDGEKRRRRKFARILGSSHTRKIKPRRNNAQKATKKPTRG